MEANTLKYMSIFVGVLLFVIFGTSSLAQKDDAPVLKGPYFGQDPPGMTPEIFAP
jgi:hypothetical protein